MKTKIILNGCITIFVMPENDIDDAILKNPKDIKIEQAGDVIQSTGEPVPKGSFIITFNQEKRG